MLLTTAQIDELFSDYMAAGWSPPASLKQHIRDALQAINVFQDANSSTLNNALPIDFRTAADLPSKAAVYAIIFMKVGFPEFRFVTRRP